MAQDKAAVSDDELAGLSQEERDALAEEESDEAADAEALAALAGEGDDDDEADGDGKDTKATDKKPDAKKDAKDDADDDADADDADDADAGADDKAKKDTPAAEDGKKKDDAAAAPKKEPAVVEEEAPAPRALRYKAPAVEKYEEQVAALDTELNDATTAFRAGDMELEDFQKKQREVMGKRDQLLSAKIKADISVESSQQSAEFEWVQQVAAFKRAAKAEGIDYGAGEIEANGKKVKLEDQLDRTVKALANDPENAEWTGQQFLDEAHAIIKARFGLGTTKGTADAAAAAAELKEKAKKEGAKRKPDTSGVPKTLSGLPAAEESDAGGDPEFGHLDNLDGLDLEVAVARMTPEQQDRWSRQA